MSKKKYSRIFSAFSPQPVVHHAHRVSKKVHKSVQNSSAHVAFFIIVYLMLLIPLFFALVLSAYKDLSATREKRASIEKQLRYWQAVTQAHPDFPDAYYQAALYAIQLGENEKAVDFLHKA